MGLEKAQIAVMRGDNSMDTIDVMFNPAEYTIDTGNKYEFKPIPGMNQPIAHFVNGNTPTLTLELFFDTTEQKKDVRLYTDKIVSLLDVDSDLHTPPLCMFMWGELIFFGVIEKVTQKYKMFLESGIPVRATLAVTFKQVENVQKQKKRIPRQSADRTKQKTVKQGDSLWRIAADEYEDPGKWREIARANRLDNPHQLEPGSTLKIPRLY